MDALYRVPQLSEDWKKSRCGCATASRVADILSRTKSGWGATRANYLAELVAERLTGINAEHYQSKPMQWGNECEAQARKAYEWYRDVTVEMASFVLHPDIPQFGGTPDGFCGEDGLIQIKCPNSSTHLKYLLSGTVPREYQIQMQSELAVTGRQWNDFVSFDPRLPERLRIFSKRLLRSDEVIADIEANVKDFLQELAETIQRLEQVTSGISSVDFEKDLEYGSGFERSKDAKEFSEHEPAPEPPDPKSPNPNPPAIAEKKQRSMQVNSLFPQQTVK